MPMAAVGADEEHGLPAFIEEGEKFVFALLVQSGFDRISRGSGRFQRGDLFFCWRFSGRSTGAGIGHFTKAKNVELSP